MNTTDYFQLFSALAPEIIVAITALLVLAADLLGLQETPRSYRMSIAAGLTTVGCAGAVAWMFLNRTTGNWHGGMFVIDPLNETVKAVILLLTVFTAMLSVEAKFTRHCGEYFALLLLATAGMMFLASTEDLLMIFASLELVSLSLYVLVAFDKSSRQSAEAALKYFLFGGMSAAFLLFGFSLLYGLTGTTHVPRMAHKLFTLGVDPLGTVALVMVVVGFGFKIAAVPFHLWAPDAYQGAPLPSSAFIASGSKVASFYVFAKVLLLGFSQLGWGSDDSAMGGWMPLLSIVAALSMVLGNLAAIRQTSVRRLLAYSAIAHAGYMLVGFLALGGEAFASLLFYVTTYALTTVGTFGVLGVVEAQVGGDQLKDFAGLSRRAPVLAACLMVFLLSLAGIPPLAGFFGKFYLFAAALKTEGQSLPFLWLVILGVAMSCVSLYYYLQILKQVFVVEADERARPLAVPFLAHAVVVLLAAVIVLLGCAPTWLLTPLQEAIAELGW
ncbi:MAG: NADH-quinone oxidoreductase subunit N [Verrucomicrobia bacterium]|nr:NADH-quinone oxidoreductase subunit N [Verrucomicrobiota bacterium]NBU07461.1 NADH-quinone oxidoreductase subunit N [Pseudomonadota bacterium]NDA67351.1 NADH-quinone oxidoreductase subunit N [Verrucomicrobiota bacterium]NDB76373.1 NADH-quinone oxidoreductase subunit N [Verrucomicrobiota bacterium]NDD39184.1 NADH-quinone oxidoreductase subunit N [Verrucomicrobiota bacterium]